MKKVFICVVLGILTFQINISAQDFQKETYAKKIRSYSKMRNTVMVLTIGGAAFTIAGVVLMADGINKSNNYDYYDSVSDDGVGEAIGGLLCIYAGIFMDTGGIILWSIGGSKRSKYIRKLNSLSLNLNPDPHQSLSLSLNF